MMYRFDQSRQGHRVIQAMTCQGMSRPPGAHRDDIYQAIDQERLYQDQKWGTITMRPHEVSAWLTILRAQLNRAEMAWASSEGDAAALKAIRQLAAVSVACMEQHGVIYRAPHRTFSRRSPPVSFPRLWRAHGSDRMTLFLYADDEAEAQQQLQALNFSDYVLHSAEALIGCGVSPIEAWRLFELAHVQEAVTHWVHHPLFFGHRDPLLRDIWSEGQLFWKLWRGCTPDDSVAVFVEADSLSEARQLIFQAALDQDPLYASLDQEAIEICSCAELIWEGFADDYAFCLFERPGCDEQRRWIQQPVFYQLPQALGLQCFYEEAIVTGSVSHGGRP